MEHHVHLPADVSAEEAALLKRACASDEESRPAVRALLERKPELARAISLLGSAAEAAVLRAGAPQVIAQESALVELRALRTSLLQPGDGELERLLAERVSLCWAALQHGERVRADGWTQGIKSGTLDFYDRHVASLQADFLRASKTLAQVRRLRLPAVQVNVGENQVNVAR
jgi:hypothetical protein